MVKALVVSKLKTINVKSTGRPAPIYFQRKGVLGGKRILIGHSRFAKVGLKLLRKRK